MFDEMKETPEPKQGSQANQVWKQANNDPISILSPTTSGTAAAVVEHHNESCEGVGHA